MPTWNELFNQEEFRWKHPHEEVVELVPLLKERSAVRVLDLGCGAGRHLVHMAQCGFQMFGLDQAETGLMHSREWLGRENLQADLAMGDIEYIPFPDNFFDAVISIYVVYHKTRSGLEGVLSEMHRVLKPGGVALFSLQAKRGIRYGSGIEIEKDTFIPESGLDYGIPHHFSDLAEIAELVKAFAPMKIEFEANRNGEMRHSHWQVLVEKE